MSDIYQKIWDADQSQNGVLPILDTQAGDQSVGYVKVNSKLDQTDPELRVLTEVVIPEKKIQTYELCRKLFDNYALPEPDREVETPEEREEVHNFVHALVDIAPMQVARDYVSEQTGTSLTRERWYNTIMEMWFRRFSSGGDPDLSGFEHVVVGEQQGATVQGYHFWYKYYLDDGLAHQVQSPELLFPGLKDDRIVYLGSKAQSSQLQFPETVTISYRWMAPDYERKGIRPLTKPTGGFFVGCSVEGLLALGTVRAHVGARAPKEAVINGACYSLKVYRSPNDRHVRTFYPMFLREDGTKSGPGEGNGGKTVVTPGQVRIIAALINPKGHDPGMETVTLINTGSTEQSLDGWCVEDKQARQQVLSGLAVKAGDTVRIPLDPNGPQLSNQGGKINLMDSKGNLIHMVNYSRGQAKPEGETVLF